jgi:DNA (cytosine-5)-methyltransferase 1
VQIDYASVCSGIESASIAWRPLGWSPSWLSEIEPFPCAVLSHRHPKVPNLGNAMELTRKILSGAAAAPAILVGGTPCQDFSVAGYREGLAGDRGSLTVKFVEIADAIDLVRVQRGDDECVVVWENVVGVLEDKANAFGCFLGALAGEDCALQPAGKTWSHAGCVYGPQRAIAWRVLDAQYFGLAQRRRRVFVVASARDGFDPASVLFEREGERRDTPPRRGEGKDLAGRAPFGPAFHCGCGHLYAEELGVYGCPSCEGEEGPAAWVMAGVPAYGGHELSSDSPLFQSATLTAHGARNDVESETFVIHGTQDPDVAVEIAHPLASNWGLENAVFQGRRARRLTPREYERLMGYEDDYTLIPWAGKPAGECPDGHRYKALGNSKAVPVMRWLGERLHRAIYSEYS